MRINIYRTKLDENKLNILVKEKGINYAEKERLTGPDKVVKFMNDVFDMKNLAEEHVYMLAVDSKNNIIGTFPISHGTVNLSFMSPREIFIKALLCGAVNIIICHNHPSGDTSPSPEDIKATKRLQEAGKLIGINLQDHIIIGNSYTSLREMGEI